MKKKLRLTLVLSLYGLMLTSTGANAYLAFGTSYLSSTAGWAHRREGDHIVVAYVRPYGPVDQLREGDEIVALNGRELKSIIDKSNFFARAERGTPYTLLVRREGQLIELRLRTVPVSYATWLSVFIDTILSPALFLFVGLLIFLLKPDDKQALLLSLIFACLGNSPSAEWLAPVWLRLLMSAAFVLSGLMFPLFLHFSLIFPERSRLADKLLRRPLLLYLPTLIIILPNLLIISYERVVAPDLQESVPLSLFLRFATVFQLAHVIGGLALMVLNYRHAGQVSRRKLRVLLAGSIIGALPTLAIVTASLFISELSIQRMLGEWHWVVVPLATLLVPLSFAYAIARHKVIPVSLIIRRSLQYLLAKNGLRVLLSLPLIGLIFSVIANRDRNLSDILLRNSFYFYLLLVVAITFGLFFRRRLTDWIDRKFFREAYSQEKILRELIDDVKRLDSIPEMSRRVTEQVDRALHPERAYLFYRGEEARDLSLSYTSGGSGEKMKIPEDFQLLRLMELQGGAQDFPFPQKNNLPQAEKDWLASLGTKLIVPMTGTDSRLAGLFLLGEKKSEVPYTATDRALLETLADQIAIVYENVRLKERVERERRIKREVLVRLDEKQINLLKECPRCGSCFDGSAEVCSQDGAELALTLPVERVIDGRYRLERVIGHGGMGAVYEAHDTRLNRRVAVKILKGNMFGNADALRRFEREAQASARLNHPNIVTVFDYGVLQTEGAYLVMELIRGETLRGHLKRLKHIPPVLAAEWFDQVLEAMKTAHASGVIHRDLKPENIFISRGEAEETGEAIVKVLDFGLAKLSTEVASDPDSPTLPLTSPGVVMGTFGYMPPEQLTGESVDERSDLFSIGVMMVEALTGKRPFSGKTHMELLSNIMHGSFHLPARSDEERRLGEALRKSLARERHARYASASEMQKALIPALRACPEITQDEMSAQSADTFIIKR